MNGAEFRKWRRSLEVTQQMVAEYVGCNRSTICRFEKGQIELLPHLADKLIEFKKSTINKENCKFELEIREKGKVR